MSDSHDAHDVQKSVRRYLYVFYALIAGTALTVWVNTLHFDSIRLTVTIALIIASVKAFLVAGYFMHLMSEKKLIYSLLVATVFFFAGMMYLIVWSRDQMPQGSAHYGEAPVEHFGGSSSTPPAQH